MKPSREIRRAAAWLVDQAEAAKAGGGLDVPEGEIAFARQRLKACAAGLLAGFHKPDRLAKVPAPEGQPSPCAEASGDGNV